MRSRKAPKPSRNSPRLERYRLFLGITAESFFLTVPEFDKTKLGSGLGPSTESVFYEDDEFNMFMLVGDKHAHARMQQQQLPTPMM
mmetsp:Transcript_38919/g.94239  ORF Transcript_38919/g.94239 Transcript_38919/m.94239 type:complete len:86 (+) Transcript_38919:438-695(+)